MYKMDVGAAETSCPYIRLMVFSLITYGAPGETRTPNLLIRSCSKPCPRLYGGRESAG
jgi:hypothetical protein